MARRNQPYLPLYVQDFLTDEKLAECSAQATGVYIRIMCLMHKSETYGKILLKQKHKQTDKQIKNFALMLAKHLPYTVEVIFDSITELVEERVLTVEEDYLVQKRMVNDNELSIKRSISGRKGGKKTLSKSQNFAQAKLQANTENEIENENENNNVSIKEDSKEEKPKKLKYADFVSMLPEEHEKLLSEFGDTATTRMVEILNNYKGAKGKKYKSDYLAIRNWVITRYKEETNGSRNYNRNEGISRIVTSTQTRKTTIPD